VKLGAQMSSRPTTLAQRVPPPVRRALAVVGLAALAGLAALVALSDDPKTFESESSFAIRPSETVPPDQLPDVVGTLAQSDSAVTETIVDILGSDLLRDTAADTAGIPAGSVGESGTPYVWTASRRLGSAIVDIKLTGPNDAKLLALQTAAADEAASFVEQNFSLYRLESLTAPTSSPDEVGPKTGRTVGLAFVLGALLGVALLFLERKLRSSLGTPTLDRGADGRPMGTDNMTGETDRLESMVRDSVGGGASVRRVGPGRVEVAHPADRRERDREAARRRR
jgi:hypothetical protein